MAPALENGVVMIPAETLGRAFNYHVFRERNGFRVRIVSKTSTTAPAVSETLISGTDELYSTVRRPVATTFTKSNALTVDNLMYAKTD